jgi:hypothetical protein
MSTQPPPPAAAPPLPATKPPGDVEIKIVSHSNLFYWWPVWAVGLIMALLTYIDGHYLAIVPPGTKAETERNVQGFDQQGPRDVLVVTKPEKGEDRRLPIDPNTGKPADPRLHMALNKSYGVIFAVVLLLVIVITNVPLRGLWSVIVIVVIILLTIIFALAGWWDPILDTFRLLHIHINAGGYLFLSLALLAIWLITFLFFDQQLYIVFSAGQMRVCTEIGGGEKAYPTEGMALEKQRSDLFRHWILGLGSGDLVVNTAGAQVHHFDLPNVLFIGKKVQQITDLMRERQVVRGR